jgi:hypothetical protein
MSVHSSTFGGVRLSAEDAKKFKDQVTYGRPKQAAVQSFVRGKKLADEFVKQGFAKLKP